MQIFISLSSYRVLISNAIYEGKRSLNTTSTPSRLKFAHPPLIPPPLPSPSPLRFAAYHMQSPRNEPLPSLEGCGLKSKCLISFGNADPLHPPLPFPEGCGRVRPTWWRNGGGGYMRGDPCSGRPGQCVQKITTFVVVHFFCSFHPTDTSVTPYGPSLRKV